ncbi:NAD-dependent epimerase/dehydratase family protein [uncultured Bacteroides sp.]|uniref:NAD-dependent epimerase/dehydratase family protein n=1 Tax=uncultured Bacteroides sp. TaxID=162156 RepID=UPI0026125207|nr:NAD-dependent epimerase/dehydratase family protein [uncultured Bacteroides sp.]
MKKILITGAGSYIGTNVECYLQSQGNYKVVTVDTKGDAWRNIDYSKYDVVFHVAGIAHVNADPKLKPLYYQVNRDLTIEVARYAKSHGVRQFIFMSSQIVFHESKSLKSEVLTSETKENPNGFYGDSKLQAEIGLKELESDTFKVCILRPPMIYGPNAKGNFPRLAKLASITPIFPNWHNKRSMLYIDNLSEFVKQVIDRELRGTFYPQNRELSDTVEIIRYLAKLCGHKIWITKLLNPFIWLFSFILQPINKMFATYYYDSSMSNYGFDYQIVSLEDSLKRIAESINKK